MTLAIVAISFAAQRVSAPSESTLAITGILLVMASAAQVWPLHLSTKVKITVDDMPTFAAALLLPGFEAMLLAGASTLIGLRFRNTRMRWYNRGFNAASSTLGVGAASATYASLNGPMPPTMAATAAILAAGMVKYLVQAILVDVVVALQLKRRPLEGWWQVHQRDLPYESALYLLGALADPLRRADGRDAPGAARDRARPAADAGHDPRARRPHRPARPLHARPLAARRGAGRTPGAADEAREHADPAHPRCRARPRHRQD